MNMIGLEKYFHHPFVSVFFWFTSMGVCLPFYFIFLKKSKDSSSPAGKPPMPFYVALYPALTDVVGSSANLVGM